MKIVWSAFLCLALCLSSIFVASHTAEAALGPAAMRLLGLFQALARNSDNPAVRRLCTNLMEDLVLRSGSRLDDIRPALRNAIAEFGDEGVTITTRAANTGEAVTTLRVTRSNIDEVIEHFRTGNTRFILTRALAENGTALGDDVLRTFFMQHDALARSIDDLIVGGVDNLFRHGDEAASAATVIQRQAQLRTFAGQLEGQLDAYYRAVAAGTTPLPLSPTALSGLRNNLHITHEALRRAYVRHGAQRFANELGNNDCVLKTLVNELATEVRAGNRVPADMADIERMLFMLNDWPTHLSRQGAENLAQTLRRRIGELPGISGADEVTEILSRCFGVRS